MAANPTPLHVKVAPKGMGLNDFVAHEEGYYAEEGIDIELDWKTFRGTQSSWKKYDYFQRPQDQPYTGGGGEQVVQCACLWGTISNASAGMGRVVADCYGVSPWSIFVRPESGIRKPEDLRDVPIAVGMRAGSHFNVPFRLEKFMPLERIKTVNVGGFGARLTADRKSALAPGVPAGPAPDPSGTSWSGIGLAMIFVLFTYGGWNDGAYISAEVRNRERNMSRALFLSIGLVTLLYVLVNLAYVNGLGFAAVAKSDAVAADLLARVWGTAGEKLISVLVALATLTSINGSMIVGARSNYALGREWPFLRWLGHWDDASGSPRNAYLMQGTIALVLVGLGMIERRGFQTLVDFTAPVFWSFFLLTGVSLFVLRAKHPDAPRPYRVPLYPVTPAVFVASSAYMLYSSLAYTGKGALVGVGVLAAGAVVLVLGRLKSRA